MMMFGEINAVILVFIALDPKVPEGLGGNCTPIRKLLGFSLTNVLMNTINNQSCYSLCSEGKNEAAC